MIKGLAVQILAPTVHILKRLQIRNLSQRFKKSPSITSRHPPLAKWLLMGEKEANLNIVFSTTPYKKNVLKYVLYTNVNFFN